MPARKMKVEVYDESGNRYVISFEGRVTREKALKILDIIELLGGMPISEPIEYLHDLSKIEKVLFIVKKNFPIVWFSAKEVQKVYEKETGEFISLSAVSTYLTRLADKGILIKAKNGSRISFRLASRELKEVIRPF
ncbi:MAG: hypothetical protein QW502_01220 [Candidatus Bathyarchaeia archaeon]|nr:hypothetical protein [Candidatus Bathyarchaeota archaeon]